MIVLANGKSYNTIAIYSSKEMFQGQQREVFNIHFNADEYTLNDIATLYKDTTPFSDIKIYSDTPDEEGKIKRWVRLVQPGSYGEVSKGIISKENVSDNENPDFGATDAFGTNHFLQPIDKNQPSYSDCSLGTLKWPLNDTDLEVQDERTLKLLAGNTSDENNYASTANSTTFGSKSWDDLKDDNYAPFGYLRIFDYLDSK